MPTASAADEERFIRELIPVSGIDSEVALNIIRASQFLFEALSRNLRRFGVSEPQFNVLVVLDDHPEGLTMVEIGRRMLVSRAGVTGLVRGLEERGWVRREKCPEDARAVRVRITGHGAATLEKVLPSHLERVGEMVGATFSPREKEQLIALLTRLRCHLAAGRGTGAAVQPNEEWRDR